MNNKLIIAAAGSGKTTFLIETACKSTDQSILITTYTEANCAEIKKIIIEKKGCIPSHITIQTWFSFLLQHGVRPYQSVLNGTIHDVSIGFFLTSERSAKKGFYKGKPMYWGEKDFLKFYFTPDYKIFSDKIAKFVCNVNAASKGEVISRISRLFDCIFIDEVQDLAGYDLELLKLLFLSRSTILLVGDPRQVTYLTNNPAKHEKYSSGKIVDFIKTELGKNVKCEIDTETLNKSHRNNQKICDFSSRLFPTLPTPEACSCGKCRAGLADHNGVYFILREDVEKYLENFNPVQLRWNSLTKINKCHNFLNFGESKGLTFDRVLIYPTEDMKKWLIDNNSILAFGTRAKLYVGITRARKSCAFVWDDTKNYVAGAEYFSFG